METRVRCCEGPGSTWLWTLPEMDQSRGFTLLTLLIVPSRTNFLHLGLLSLVCVGFSRLVREQTSRSTIRSVTEAQPGSQQQISRKLKQFFPQHLLCDHTQVVSSTPRNIHPIKTSSSARCQKSTQKQSKSLHCWLKTNVGEAGSFPGKVP